MAAAIRSDLEYEVVYSMRIEEMTSTLLRRFDKAASWSQIVLGVAVVTTAAPIATGLAVACVAAYQLVSQPGVEATKSAASKERWRSLYRELGSLTDPELHAKVKAIEEHDTPVMGGLKLAAQYAAAVQLGRDVDALPPLSRWQKIMGILAS